jgi:transglutaminase-like putative cysteine protease
MMSNIYPVFLLTLTILHQGLGLCVSNETYVAWAVESAWNEMSEARRLVEFRDQTAFDRDLCIYEDESQAKKLALTFLRENVMAFDRSQLETLGFDANEEDVDGLNAGIIGPTIYLAFEAKRNYTWTAKLCKPLFYEYVLNYASTNEARTNWRPLLTNVIRPLLQEHQPKSIRQVVKLLNTHIWTLLAPRHADSIVFVGGQTPLIFDPMSVLAFGYASCTGLAILFVNVLRAAGVPARIAGTPAWWGQRQEGNHNWVEVLDEDGQWYFMEPSPQQATIDTLERDPCERWFCSRERFGNIVNRTLVYATRMDQKHAETNYPLAWEWNSTDVPGDNVTEYYEKVCSRC